MSVLVACSLVQHWHCNYFNLNLRFFNFRLVWRKWNRRSEHIAQNTDLNRSIRLFADVPVRNHRSHHLRVVMGCFVWPKSTEMYYVVTAPRCIKLTSNAVFAMVGNDTKCFDRIDNVIVCLSQVFVSWSIETAPGLVDRSSATRSSLDQTAFGSIELLHWKGCFVLCTLAVQQFSCSKCLLVSHLAPRDNQIIALLSTNYQFSLLVSVFPVSVEWRGAKSNMIEASIIMFVFTL